MNFEKHLFISFAHIDNQSMTEEEKGWISQFHISLSSFLSMRLGGHAEIWRSNQLQGNDVLNEEILSQFPKTALLLSVLSPRYMKSEWCHREVNAFCEAAEKTGGVVVNKKARIFKVIKAPVKTQEGLPEFLQDTLGYDFYVDDGGAPLELDPDINPQDYKRKVNKLAYDISEMLEDLNAGSGQDSGSFDDQTEASSHDEQTSGSGEPASSDKPIIYLAECGYDRKETREILQSDLEQHGYTVLPNKPLPMEVQDEFIESVNGVLENCKLSIHLIGESFGTTPDGPTMKSIVVLQNELAAKQSQAKDLKRVIWLPEGTTGQNNLQQQFIQELHSNAEIQMGADLITGDVEALKSTIHAMLKELETPAPQPSEERADTTEGNKLIYLICNEKDRKATIPLRKFCKNEGFDIVLPAFEGDPTTIRNAHKQLMTDCDAVILFYGEGSEAWKRTINSELKKMPGYRQGKPLLASYIFLAEPKTADKQDLIDMEEPNLINGLDGFSESEMAGFVAAMTAGATA